MQQKENRQKNEQTKVISGGFVLYVGKNLPVIRVFMYMSVIVGRRRKYYCSYSCFKHSKDQL